MKSVLQSVKKGRAAVKEAIQAVNLPPPVNVGGKQLKFERKLGEGGFAVVWLCKDEYDNQFALKKCLVQTPEQLKTMTSELELLKALKHPHIISVVGSEKRNMGPHTEFYILMEYAEKSLLGMMQERHAENRRFSEKEVLRIFSDIVSAVAHCHSQNPPVAHRDLKIENVLLGQDKLFKLCDFGSCIRTAYEPQSYRDCSAAEEEIDRNTTLCYRAPEMCDLMSKRRIDEKCDIWALGCLLYYLCFFELPFEEQKLQIINGRYTIPADHSFQPAVVELIRACLTLDPTARPDIWLVAEQVAALRGVANKSPRPETYVPQAVSIGGSPAGAEARPAPPPAAKAAPSAAPVAKPPAVKAGGALFSQLDWQDGSGAVVKPAAAAAAAHTSPVSPSPIFSPPKPTPPRQSPTEQPKPKADFAMPDFDDLSISPATPAPAPTTSFDLFSAEPAKPAPTSAGAGLDDFDFNPRSAPTAAAPVFDSNDLFAAAPFDAAFNPRGGPAAPAPIVPPAPTSPAVAAKADLFADNGALFGDSLFPPPKPIGGSGPQSPLKEGKAEGGPSVDAMASKLLEGFLSSSAGDSPRSNPKPASKPAYVPLGTAKSGAGLFPPQHQRSGSSEQAGAKDPFASLF